MSRNYQPSTIQNYAAAESTSPATTEIMSYCEKVPSLLLNMQYDHWVKFEVLKLKCRNRRVVNDKIRRLKALVKYINVVRR